LNAGDNILALVYQKDMRKSEEIESCVSSFIKRIKK
jgi:hypothetical protein